MQHGPGCHATLHTEICEIHLINQSSQNWTDSEKNE